MVSLTSQALLLIQRMPLVLLSEILQEELVHVPAGSGTGISWRHYLLCQGAPLLHLQCPCWARKREFQYPQEMPWNAGIESLSSSQVFLRAVPTEGMSDMMEETKFSEFGQATSSSFLSGITAALWQWEQCCYIYRISTFRPRYSKFDLSTCSKIHHIVLTWLSEETSLCHWSHLESY